MEKDKQQEDFVNPATDKRTEKATKREPNPKPMQKIFESTAQHWSAWGCGMAPSLPFQLACVLEPRSSLCRVVRVELGP